MNGGWSAWAIVTECDAACGGGVMTVKRDCNFPTPSGGDLCLTETNTRESVETKAGMECNKHPCGMFQFSWEFFFSKFIHLFVILFLKNMIDQ